MKFIERVKSEIAGELSSDKKATETFAVSHADYNATKTYLESRLSAIETRLGIIAPAPPIVNAINGEKA